MIESDAYMALQGLTVLRFSNERVLKDTDSVVDEIASRLVGQAVSGAGEKTK